MVKKKKNKTTYLIGAAIVFVSILFVFFYFKSIEVKELKMDAEVTCPKCAGFNLNTDAVHFGKVPLGGSAVRNITIQGDSKNHKVVLKAYGELAKWVSTTQNDFKLNAWETRGDIALVLKVPKDAEMRKYEGTLKIYFYPG